jgi:hypothetical protein
MHAGEVDIIFILQQAADEQRRRLGVERDADALARELLRRPDRLAVDRDEAVTEDARGKDRQRNHLPAAGGVPADDLGARHFAGVEIEILPHAVEDLPRIVDGEKGEIDAFGLHLAGIERQHAVIEAAGEGHRNLGHASLSPASDPG